MKKNNNNKAFSLAEISVAIVIVGVLIMMSLTNAKKLMPDKDKTKFMKAYTNIETIVSNLVNDENIYSSAKLLRDYTPIELTDPNGNLTGENFGVLDPTAKFRDAFKYNLHVVEDNINCSVLNSDKANICFKSDEGIVYGIPNSDFSDTDASMIPIQRQQLNAGGTLANISGQFNYYLPITIYTSWGNENKRNMEKDAFFVGVSYKGKIKVLKSDNSICASHPEYNQCNEEEFLKSNSVKGKSK